MNQEFFVPGWDQLSPVQKNLVEEWIRGALRAKAAKEALIKSYCDLNFSESASYVENLSLEPFEVFGSQSSLEERIELSSMRVESPLDLPRLSDCIASCRGKVNEEECRKECQKKFT